MIELRTVGPEHLDAVAGVFGPARQTRRCWCTAFCSTSWQFASGWFGGGNRRRFEAAAAVDPAPMGVVAVEDGEPAGWCACGPRSRYLAGGRSALRTGRPDGDDDGRVWLIPCTVVRPGHRRGHLVVPLLRGAVAVAAERGAAAVEAWPLARGVRNPADDHLGREAVFANLGFTPVRRPTPTRVVMRLDLVS